MKKESKIFFVVFFLFILASILFTYYDTIVLGRFSIFISEDDIPAYTDLVKRVTEPTSSYVQ